MQNLIKKRRMHLFEIVGLEIAVAAKTPTGFPGVISLGKSVLLLQWG
jgi:hypothetical protein